MPAGSIFTKTTRSTKPNSPPGSNKPPPSPVGTPPAGNDLRRRERLPRRRRERAPPAVWGRTAIAWLLGALISRGLARQETARLIPAILLLTPILLLLSLWQSGQSGVHRWLSLGPLNWNVAFLCLPAAIVALARSQSLLRAALSPLFPRRTAPATTLASYFLTISLMPLVGAFPVPLTGMGMSPILGYWLGIGVLSATTKPAMLT
jgi:hypothetical protein